MSYTTRGTKNLIKIITFSGFKKQKVACLLPALVSVFVSRDREAFTEAVNRCLAQLGREDFNFSNNYHLYKKVVIWEDVEPAEKDLLLVLASALVVKKESFKERVK